MEVCDDCCDVVTHVVATGTNNLGEYVSIQVRQALLPAERRATRPRRGGANRSRGHAPTDRLESELDPSGCSLSANGPPLLTVAMYLVIISLDFGS